LCSGGSCGFTCLPGFADCNGLAADGCEVNLNASPAHCGACNRACTGGTVCSAGVCACPAGQTLCSGVCTDLLNDTSHCGTCTTVCNPGQACAAGVCVGGGMLRITMTWSRGGDMDLHVVTPAGREIYYANTSADGGFLDRDDTIGTGPENVFWSSNAPSGTYLVCAVPYNISGSTNVTVDVVRPGYTTLTFTGTRSASTGNQVCSRSSSTFIGSFTHP
jgi:hypothetical protein